MSDYHTLKTNYPIKKGHSKILVNNLKDSYTAIVNNPNLELITNAESKKMSICDTIQIYNEDNVLIAIITKLIDNNTIIINL